MSTVVSQVLYTTDGPLHFITSICDQLKLTDVLWGITHGFKSTDDMERDGDILEEAGQG